MDKKTCRITIRVTREEAELFKNHAEDRRLSVSEFLRNCAYEKLAPKPRVDFTDQERRDIALAFVELAKRFNHETGSIGEQKILVTPLIPDDCIMMINERGDHVILKGLSK